MGLFHVLVSNQAFPPDTFRSRFTAEAEIGWAACQTMPSWLRSSIRRIPARAKLGQRDLYDGTISTRRPDHGQGSRWFCLHFRHPGALPEFPIGQERGVLISGRRVHPAPTRSMQCLHSPCWQRQKNAESRMSFHLDPCSIEFLISYIQTWAR